MCSIFKPCVFFLCQFSTGLIGDERYRPNSAAQAGLMLRQRYRERPLLMKYKGCVWAFFLLISPACEVS